ncbi:MAG TPA: M20 family metallopeptidase [Mycobacteriales bacterium]|nr:M20 family metallopeptidase [Mycobacteriales bacterium]
MTSTEHAASAMLAELRSRQARLVEDLATLVGIESPSQDVVATAAVCDAVSRLGADLLGAIPERHEVQGRTHLRWRLGGPTRVLLLMHADTVWPKGTTARWPFAVRDGRASGPGVFDMKAGLIQGLHALSVLDDVEGVGVLVTTDEEIGSPSSQQLIEETARGADAVLVLEPSAGGAVKTARKGVAMFDLAVVGRAAHAGLEPERGVNAAVEMAHQILAIAQVGDPALGTTVTPTLASAGTTMNTVPGTAAVHVDVRVTRLDEAARVDAALHALRPVLPDARLELSGGVNRPPFQESASAALFDRARRLASELGLEPLQSVIVGGGSDGNFTAALGVPTLDGLGAVGDGAHAEGEHVILGTVAERAALVAALVADLLR